MGVIATLNDIKQGTTLIYNGEPHVVVQSNFMRTAQRKPVMQCKLKNLTTGKVVEYSFKAGERVEEADLARRKASFLYKDQTGYTFMDSETYDQFVLNEDLIGPGAKFLKESVEVDTVYYNDKPISVNLPKKIELKVVETNPAVRGDTAQGAVYKPAKLETGATINVPIFIKEDEVIRVNTDTGEYVERVNS